MNSAGKIAIILLLLGIAGCKHKVQTAAVPPAPDKVYTPEDVAKQGLPQPPPPEVAKVDPPKQESPPPPPPKAKPKHKPKAKPADSTQVQVAKDTALTAAPPAEEASAGQPSDTSPIGQLSSSSDSGSAVTHQSIQKLIDDTENNLNKRKLSSDQEQTATQIREFLKKAKDALKQEDLDGANTLATKAKVLLEELNKG